MSDTSGAILGRMRQDIDRGVYGDGAFRDLAERAYKEGERYVAESRSIDAQIEALEESRGRLDASLAQLVDSLDRLEDERLAELARVWEERGA